MHDLTLKPGRKTSEFLVTLATIVTAWLASVLTVLTDIGPTLPEKYKPWVLIATLTLTTIQTSVYNIRRGKIKEAALGAVVGYNAVAQKVAEAHTTITTDGPPIVTQELTGSQDDVEQPAPSAGLPAEDGSGEIDLGAVEYEKLD